jgi:hypothetical protein
MRVMHDPYKVLRGCVVRFSQSLMLLPPFAQGIKPTEVDGCRDTKASASTNEGPTLARSSSDTTST